ncbi:hypothetical protein NC652_027937 [Populus alba x Populus x berolinensis]|nr:hypothetical protein NC652_027937 [Populus alba x Populus x berolinensis]
MSPVGKLWEGITLKPGSSEKRVSSIPDLPCFSEENESTNEVPETFQDGDGSEQTENQSILGANDVERAKESHDNRFNKPILFGKTSLRKGDSGLAGMKLKHNNIVSNITSFIPLVHQKQAAAVVTGINCLDPSSVFCSLNNETFLLHLQALVKNGKPKTI